MIGEIIRFTSFLLPIPFMILFYIKTDKLNFLKKYNILTLFIPIFASLCFDDTGFNLGLITTYMIFVLFGTSIFNSKGWGYPQALSISFLLTYFGSFLWELPTLIYTIIIRGGIDGAFPLHVIYIFPILFIFEKIKINQPKKTTITLLAWMIFYSVLALFALISINADIWNVTQNTTAMQAIEQVSWMMNRIIVITGLFAIYIKSTIRKEQKP